MNERMRQKQAETWKSRAAEVDTDRLHYIAFGNLFGYVYQPDEVKWKVVEEERYKIAITLTEVLAAEKYLREQLRYIDTLPNYPLPKVHQKLSRYYRQYVGFVNASAERVVWINGVWPGDPLDKGIVLVKDAGNFYWHACVNLSSGTVYGLFINEGT